MGNDIFDGQMLAEKLLKLNNSQQSIESLSRFCVSNRKRAKEIVESWDKLFSSSQKEQRISFLYLANDILQNSRRKGSEFVNEFWKILPAALRHVYDSDENGKKVVTRLVDIWEERKVFGSRGRGLKDEIMGKNPLPSSTSNGKSSNPIKIVKRDAHSLRLKLAIGCLPEKILTALNLVHDEHLNEEAALNKCNTGVHQLGKLVEDVENTLAQGNHLGSTLVNDLQEQEKELKQIVAQLENAEAARDTLLSQLKDALWEQESRKELVCTQLLAARDKIEQATNIRKRLGRAPEPMRVLEQNLSPVQLNNIPPQPSYTQPSISFAPLQTAEEDKKAAAAAVAAKLAASTSSALMLTSVLSSLVAEQAASMNGSLNSTGFSSGLPAFNPEKRPRLEISDVNSSDTGNSSFFTNLQQPSAANVPLTPSTSLQPISQPNQLQAAFAPPPPPPPPPHSPVNPPANQYVQSTGLMAGGIPYGYGSNNNLQPPPPPPPLPPHVAIGLPRPNSQPSQSQQSPAHQAQQQQQPSTAGFYRPPGIGFYGQSHPSTPPPPVPRQ